MAEEELKVVRLRDDFYRDGFYRVVLALLLIFIAIILLVTASLYLHVTKPDPVNFSTGKEWRVLPPVPLDQAYLNIADLIQWVSSSITTVWTLDFLHYNDQLKVYAKYFTNNGWRKFSDILNIYANNNTVTTSKLFVNGAPAGAPFVLNQGILQGKYAWWVQMPINLSYISYNTTNSNSLTLQILVVRVPTDNNLDGVAIENIIVNKGGENQANANANG